MPFDAIVLRALEEEWRRTLVGTRFDTAQVRPGSLLLQGWHPDRGERSNLLIVLTPGLARMHRTRHLFVSPKKTWPPFLHRLLPFTVTGISVPAFERVVHLAIVRPGDWDEPVPMTLVVELAGHLTNVILVDPATNRVQDALKKIPPGQPGRPVWPQMPYEPPPAVKNPCLTQSPADLPPWARQLHAAAPEGFWPAFCGDWAAGRYQGYVLDTGTARDVWVYPRPGFSAVPVNNLEEALDTIFRERESQLEIVQLRRQLETAWHRRLDHLRERLREAHAQSEENPERYRELGDLWLAYQYQCQPGATLAVPGLFNPDQITELDLPADSTARAEAERAYKAYRKAKQRVDVAGRLLPALKSEIDEIEHKLARLAASPEDTAWLQAELAQTQPRARRHSALGATSYRRFESAGGYRLWVGRSQEENQQLTFKEARPDDVWFHVKQAGGAHVVLFTGKAHPNLEDLLDAAHLAAFYSTAGQSSLVPVDYTRRKYVRKRPHAGPGQVLYKQEKTLYITPDPDRLRRLGAIREKLTDS